MTISQQKVDTPVVDAPVQTALTGEVFDVAIVGAGVVGCAIARRFTLKGAHVALIEKAGDILDGASKGNSAILHTGFDAPPDSTELACIRDGYRDYIEIHQDLGLALETSGAHVVAWSDQEAERLDAIVTQAHANGVADVARISAAQLLRKEPNLSGGAKAAVFVPGESIIDPWTAPYAYLRQALINGCEIFLSSAVTGGAYGGGAWQLQTTQGTLTAKHVINCAGLYGDRLDQTVLGKAAFTIAPRKGQFVVFDKAAAPLVNSIILPVPSVRTKGVVLCRTVFGNLLIGPTAEDQGSRVDASTDTEALEALIATGIAKIPKLKDMPVTAAYAGLRPACEFKDYQIEAKPGQNWITVGAIRSTGLSSALGIARYVYALYEPSGAEHKAIINPKVPAVPALAQNGERDWQRGGHGEIICHCELVTKREIQQALSGPLGARSLSGLKRQTRATMGRCQGFYCSARLAELTDGQFELPLAREFANE